MKPEPVYSGSTFRQKKGGHPMANARVEGLGKQEVSFEEIPCFAQIQSLLKDDWSNPSLLYYFLKHSEVARILRECYASWKLLELAYFWTSVNMSNLNDIDGWFMKAPSAQALRNRLQNVSAWMGDLVLERTKSGSFRVMDFGSGPGPHAIESLKGATDGLLWDCVDIDCLALDFGEMRVAEAGLSDCVKFRRLDFTRRSGFPQNEADKADFALMIGILCGMSVEDAAACLRVIQPHLKSGAEILAATLLTSAFEKDPWSFRIYCNVLGWPLRPKTMEEVREVFKLAGYTVIDIFSESEDGDGQYAIVHARLP